ncbi:MAG: ferrous iron transport protein A [Myxococcales bacterium]|nr:ferrous iron transport protein A [Myxococcales bacterium]
MNLAQAEIGQIVTVERVGGERAFRRRLMELGLVPGTRIEVLGVAPLGDPIELLVRGCSLSIRRSEAEQVAVVAVEIARDSEPEHAPLEPELGAPSVM